MFPFRFDKIIGDNFKEANNFNGKDKSIEYIRNLMKNIKNYEPFEVGNIDSLHQVMEKIIDNPSILNELNVNRDKVRDINDDVKSLEELYRRLIK